MAKKEKKKEEEEVPVEPESEPEPKPEPKPEPESESEVIRKKPKKSTHHKGTYTTDVGTIKTFTFLVVYENDNPNKQHIGGQIEFSQINETPKGNFKVLAETGNTIREFKQVRISEEDLPNGVEMEVSKKYRFTAKERTKTEKE